MKKVFVLVFVCIAFNAASLFANNIQVTESTMTPPDTNASYRMISFNLSWDNSWRKDITGDGYAEPYNHDAAWIFVKFKKRNEGWFHATLSTEASDHSCPEDAEIITVDDGKGVFIRRSANGTGTNDWENIQLRWNFSEDDIDYNADIDGIKVLALEMVYVPEGPFYIGDPDGALSELQNNFYKYGAGAYEITSENAISVEDSEGNLWYDNDQCMGGDQTGPIPAEFPKGYNDFYCMKYEGTQGQYVDFLNTLPSTIATSIHQLDCGTRRSLTYFENAYTCTRPDRAMPLYKGNSSGGNAHWNILYYLDWSGLRPMTEFEYEKTCRGANQQAIDREFAWGNTTYVSATSISGEENGTETISNTGANVNFTSGNFSGGDGCVGTLRVGIFAKSSTTREESGAAYYGVLDMSGSLLEMTVSVGSVNGRSYTGLNGDGICENGTLPSYWPQLTYNDDNYCNYSFRGGCWRLYSYRTTYCGSYQYFNNGNGRVANRSHNLFLNDQTGYNYTLCGIITAEYATFGIRGVRTAP